RLRFRWRDVELQEPAASPMGTVPGLCSLFANAPAAFDRLPQVLLVSHPIEAGDRATEREVELPEQRVQPGWCHARPFIVRTLNGKRSDKIPEAAPARIDIGRGAVRGNCHR